jgi:GntR family transcriptional regulator
MVALSLDRSKSKPLYLQLEQAIIQQIESGLALPGDQLPSERELSESLGISRQTTRQTINRLVLYGLLYRQPGKGTYVRSTKTAIGRSQVTITSQFIFDWDQQKTIWLSEPHVTPAPSFAAELLHVEPGSSLLFFEHVQINRGMRVNHVRSWVPVEFEQALLASPIEEPSILELLQNRCSPDVTASRDRIEPSIASAEEAGALGIQSDFPVQLLTGVFVTSTGKPVEAHKMVIRGDRFHLEIESNFTKAIEPE